MSAIVNLGGIQFGGSTNQIGVYNGQNMQNAWDSNSPSMSVGGPLEGMCSTKIIGTAVLYNYSIAGQALFDSDIKNNASPVAEGP